jgi:hypothetical protein
MSDFPSPPFTDRTVTCRDCARPFLLEAHEQASYARKDLQQPKRCADCRKLKAARNAAAAGGRPHMDGYEYRG